MHSLHTKLFDLMPARRSTLVDITDDERALSAFCVSGMREYDKLVLLLEHDYDLSPRQYETAFANSLAVCQFINRALCLIGKSL